jgi:phosphomannomutase
MQINPAIFKAYDIRGIVDKDFTVKHAYQIAQSYVKIIKPGGTVVVGMDVRLTSKQIKAAVIKGLTDSGINVLDIGLSSTEMYYFAVGFYKTAGGIQVTASHNPKEYNGFKMVKENVEPIHKDNGITAIRDLVATNPKDTLVIKKGTVTKKNILADFCKFSIDWLDRENLKPMTLVINPNFGFEGEVIKKFVSSYNLPWKLIGLNDIPNGNFPKGRPDPFVPENRPEFEALTKSSQADLGVAWDADADRVFFCSDEGKFIESYYTNHLIIKSILIGKKGEKIVYDPRYTWALIDATKELGGKPVIERVGHSYIKERMRSENAIFSGESSGHTYFRDFWYADTGLLPLIVLVNLLNKSGKRFSELINPVMKKYPMSGEINTVVADTKIMTDLIEKLYKKGGKISKLDGLSIEYADWRFNLRESNTEPLLRLNVEGKTKALVQAKTKELLKIIRG